MQVVRPSQWDGAIIRFFDNLSVTHYSGPMLEENHYYPFGLTMAGISDKALKSNYAENKYRWNKKNELQNKEFSDGSGLEQYDATYRSYDPQVGRFWQIDPMSNEQEDISGFAFASNNPILLNDPLGLLSDSSHPQVRETVTVTANRQSGTSTEQSGVGMFLGIGGIPYPATPGIGTGLGPLPIIGAAIWARVKVGELARKAEAKRWHLTYIKFGPRGQVYVGRCSGYGETAEDVLRRYDANHRMNQYGYGPATLDKAISGSVYSKIERATGLPMTQVVDPLADLIATEVSGYSATRGREQQLYAFFKNAGKEMGNSINPVWQYNPYGPGYYWSSNIAFGPLVSWDQLYK